MPNDLAVQVDLFEVLCWSLSDPLIVCAIALLLVTVAWNTIRTLGARSARWGCSWRSSMKRYAQLACRQECYFPFHVYMYGQWLGSLPFPLLSILPSLLSSFRILCTHCRVTVCVLLVCIHPTVHHSIFSLLLSISPYLF